MVGAFKNLHQQLTLCTLRHVDEDNLFRDYVLFRRENFVQLLEDNLIWLQRKAKGRLEEGKKVIQQARTLLPSSLQMEGEVSESVLPTGFFSLSWLLFSLSLVVVKSLTRFTSFSTVTFFFESSRFTCLWLVSDVSGVCSAPEFS